MEKFYTVVMGYGDQSADYARNVLGHGGGNVFPDLEGKCSCGAQIRSNDKKVACPACGQKVELALKETFSSWGRKTGGVIDSECRFIERAANHRV